MGTAMGRRRVGRMFRRHPVTLLYTFTWSVIVLAITLHYALT